MESAAARSRRRPAIRLLCPKKSLVTTLSPSLRWLVGSPRFLPPITVAAALRYLHDDGSSPDLQRESEEIWGLLVRGLDIVGALHVGSADFEADAGRALELARALRERLFGERASHDMVGGCVDAAMGDIRFLVSEGDGLKAVEVTEVVWEDEPGRLLWEKGCLLRCELPLKLPLYVPSDELSGMKARISSLIESTASNLRDHNVSYLIEGPTTTPDQSHYSAILHSKDLNSVSLLSHNGSTKEYGANIVSCSNFFPAKRCNLSLTREGYGINQAEGINQFLLCSYQFGIKAARFQRSDAMTTFVPTTEDIQALTDLQQAVANLRAYLGLALLACTLLSFPHNAAARSFHDSTNGDVVDPTPQPLPPSVDDDGADPEEEGDYVGSGDEGQEGEDDDEDAMLGCGGEIDDKHAVLPAMVVALDKVGWPVKGLRAARFQRSDAMTTFVPYTWSVEDMQALTDLQRVVANLRAYLGLASVASTLSSFPHGATGFPTASSPPMRAVSDSKRATGDADRKLSTMEMQPRVVFPCAVTPATTDEDYNRSPNFAA
ncbi:hypothetical protein GUJ93_ZPchr0009g625 [Zizania palustris]|uniref:Uncharacterized protein n=1 Tax=Zizania palustris TaxID=103762 RepID=A0A8J5RY70_ZIZPA|nr:hypothetical protein GUJ93_ZPchr0009g625 [Zizania palustris]